MTLAIEYISTSSIILDERNPRVAPMAESMQGQPPQDWIAVALGQYAPDDEERSGSTYSSLKASIRANQGLIHPIIVTPQPEGKYVVIEGNTRVAIFRELAREDETGPWTNIPAIVRTELEERGEHAVRLQAHLVGPRPWRPYAKAKYLHSLYHDKKMSLNEILDFCGGGARRREIEDYIKAYEDMQDFYMPVIGAAPPDFSRFSAFIELQKPPVLASLAKVGYTKEDFAKWVHDSRINPLNTVRQLPRVLANPEAKKRFLSHDAREALKVLDQPAANEVVRDASIEQLATALAIKIRNLNWPEVRSIIETPDGPRAQAIVDCFVELRDIHKQLNLQTDE